MTFAPVSSQFASAVAAHHGLPKLQQAIINRTGHGTIRYGAYGGAEITADLASVAAAVESAYVLTAKDKLPKITHVTDTLSKRMFTFAGDPFVPYSTDPNHTSERARQTAAKWLAVARHLEAEEKAKAYEDAKAKAVADAAERAAEASRKKRLDELADAWFGADFFTDLGPNKSAAIKEIYRLEQKLTNEGEAA